ncbi:MAG TPA: ethanolamine ammonia-lyase subunit EutC [Bryobacteraceae bacterium]
MIKLSDYTSARVSLGITGNSLPTRPLLEFRLAHARARDAVHVPLDSSSLLAEMRNARVLHSNAKDRDEYLRRPDKGRRLNAESVETVKGSESSSVAVVVADGLSALAVHRHAVALLEKLSLDAYPVWIVQQGRVAIGDHIGSLLGAELSIVLIGERPGLSTPDSLGVYLTWNPDLARTDAERNCISNIHEQGLSYEVAAHKLLFLMSEIRRRKLSGVPLKETAAQLLG